MSGTPLTALIVEDSDDDVQLVLRELIQGGFAPTMERVESAEAMQAALGKREWDIILADYRLPGFDAPQALAILQKSGLDIPVILVSGTVGEEAAVGMMKAGAADYVMKDNLRRLPEAIRRELQEAESRRELRRADESLRATQQLAQSALDGLSAEIAILDGNGTIIAVNQVWRRVAKGTGAVPASAFEGTNYLAICDSAIGDETVDAHLVAAGIRAVAAGEKELFTLEYPCHSPTEKRWFTLRVTPCPGDGRARVVVAHEDITARKQAEEALQLTNRTILATWESMTDAFFVVDTLWRFTYVNALAAQLVGKEREELLGRSLWDVFPTAVGTIFDREYHRAVEEQVSVAFEGISLLTGTWREVRAYPSALGLSVYFRDITEQKNIDAERSRAEAAIRASEERLRLALESGRFGIFELDLKTGRYVEISPNARAQFAIQSDGDVFITDFFNKVHPDDLAAVQAEVGSAAAVQAPRFQSEYRIVSPDFSQRWISVQGTLTYDAGQPVRMLGVTQDITERKRTEEALRSGEAEQRELATQLETQRARLAAAQTVAKVGSWETELSTMTVEWSIESYRIFEVTPDQTQMTYERFLQRVHPEDRSSVDTAFVQSFQHTGTNAIVHRVLLPGERVKFVEERWQVFRDDAGNPVRALGTCQDISERHRADEALRQSEQAFRRIVETTNEGIAQLDVNGRFTYVNQRYCDMLGYTEDELLGNSAFDQMDEESRALALSSFERRRKGETEQFDRRLRHKDGSTVWGLVSTTPLKNDDGKMIGSLSMTTVITERKRAEALLEASRQRLDLARESAKLGIWDWDIVMDTLVWDDLMYALYGITHTTFSGAFEAWSGGLHPDDRARAEAEIKAALDGTRDFDTHFRVAWPDGQVRHIEAHAIVQRAPDGSPLRMVGVNRDISEQIRAVEAQRIAEVSLRESEARFRVQADAMPQMIWSADPNGNRHYHNRRWYEYTGQTVEESLGFGFALALHPDDRERTLDMWQRAWQDGEDYSIENRLRCYDGTYRWFVGRAEKVLDSKTGAVTLWVGTSTDIDDLRRVQDALRTAEEHVREREEFLRRLIDSSPDAIETIDVRGNLLSISQRGQDLMEVEDIDRIVGTKWLLLWPDEVHEDASAALEAAKLGGTGRFQGFSRKRDGATCWWDVVVGPILSNAGRPEQLLAVSRNITAEKLAEIAVGEARERLDSILGSLDDIVWSLSATSFELLYINPVAERITGHSIDMFQTDPSIWTKLIHPEDAERVAGSLSEVIQKGASVREFRIVRPDGGVRWLRERVSVSYASDGKPIRLDGIATDITERKTAEQQMIQSEKLAAVGQLVAGVAHEINNPLAAIYSSAQLLGMHSDPEVKEDSETIRNMAERVSKIVRSLLTFARGGESSHRESFKLREAIDNALEIALFLVRKEGIRLTVEIEPDLPMLFANQNQIQQVLLNLVTNAAHAVRGNPPENRRIVIGASPLMKSDAEGRNVVWLFITVSDNGCGIPEAVRKRIFEPFFTTKAIGEGTGLGLSVCYGIVESHGGTLAVESTVGIGTTFTLDLPTCA